MSPPPAARGRTALGRLVDRLRRRLSQDRRVPPATVPGLGSGEETALSAAARPEAEVADADARLDAARERLRARIQPPAPDDDG